MEITALERTRGPSTVDLIDRVDPTSLDVGQTSSVTENETVDFCIDATYTTTAVAKADPPQGVPCEDTAEYEFTVLNCAVDLEIGCTVTDGPLAGEDCRMLQGETVPQCTGSRPTELCFKYTAQTCEMSDEDTPGLVGCRDFPPGPQFTADVSITDGPTILTQETVMVGSIFCVDNGGEALPETLFINVNNAITGEGLQIVELDASCSGLGLTNLDSFGAVDLAGFTNDNGVSDCFVEVTYDYVVTNIGTIDLNITTLGRVLNGDPLNLISNVDPAELLLTPTKTYTATENAIVETCSDNQYINTAAVVAEPADGSVCEDVDDFAFDVFVGTRFPTFSPSAPPSEVPSASPSAPPTKLPSASPSMVPSTSPSETPSASPSAVPSASPSEPPSPVPTPVPTLPLPIPGDTCFVQVDVDCVPPINPETGERFEDCDSINIAPTECLEFVTRMTFRYSGGDCANSNNIQDPQIFQCEDYFGGPPDVDELGAENLIIVADIKGLGISYFTGVVPVGGLFDITNPQGGDNVIGANVNITIYEGVRARQNIRQTMIIHTSCSQVTFLKDIYGALELLAFENPSQGNVSCLVPVQFDLNIENTATSFNAILDTLTSITNFPAPNDFLNFTSQVAGQELSPGQIVPLLSEPIEIDLSVRMRYTVFTTIQGSSPEGFSCRASDFTNFTAGRPDTRPTSAPLPTSAPVSITP